MKEKSSIVARAFGVLRKEGTVALFRNALAYIRLEFLILPYALLKIKILKKNGIGLNELITFCFYGIGGLIRPLQVQEEISGMLKILDKIEPKVVVEIGTAKGGTLFLFHRIASEDATIISIDLPHGMFGGGYPVWKNPLYKAFKLPGQKLHLIRADSHRQETLNKIKNILNGENVDFLFIDGDHTYEGVKKDFEMYSPLVKDGVIVLHDIVVHPPEIGCKVNKFWNEIKNKYENMEIVNDWNQGFWGIGMIFMKPAR